MPNNIINKVKFATDRSNYEKIMNFIKTDQIGSFDFNKVIPMPEELNIECGSVTDRCIEIALTAINPITPDYGVQKEEQCYFDEIVKKLNYEKAFACYRTLLGRNEIDAALNLIDKEPKEAIGIGQTAIKNMEQYGASTWYDWRILNWGTKWNAYNSELREDNTIEFQSAWNAPTPVIRKLSLIFKRALITHEWADEDIGSNCGKMVYYGGEILEEYYPETHKEAIEFATGIWHDTPEDYGYHLNEDESDYVYIEDI